MLDFMGKPMVAWTIEAAIDSMIFDKVIVSTDDQKIADVSAQYGADVPFLRDKFSDDFSHASDASIYTLELAEKHFNQTYTNIAQLMPNTPLRTAKEIVDLA